MYSLDLLGERSRGPLRCAMQDLQLNQYGRYRPLDLREMVS